MDRLTVAATLTWVFVLAFVAYGVRLRRSPDPATSALAGLPWAFASLFGMVALVLTNGVAGWWA
ncbi:MAG TPA: hypothetical protein PKL08_00845 [Thermoanaerobaculaceae bacterium]|nr:hypothetical protein [Thermoanaerobaculaceae bacterium]